MIIDHFLEEARYLREIQAQHSDDFASLAKSLGTGHRKAYHLAQIDRSFHALGIAPDRLRRIGWTKLSHLAPIVHADNVEEWLTLAEAATAHELKLHLHGQEVDPEMKAVVLNLDKVQYQVFEKGLMARVRIGHPPVPVLRRNEDGHAVVQLADKLVGLGGHDVEVRCRSPLSDPSSSPKGLPA